MSYNYNNGDGPAVLLPAEPADVDQVSTGAPALRQIKKYLNDPTTSVKPPTTDAMNSAIAAAVAGVPQYISYASRGSAPGGQHIPTTNTGTKVTLNGDIGSRFNGSSEYVAAVSGPHLLTFNCQLDNGTGTPAGMEVDAGFAINGAAQAGGDTDNTPNPNGSRWSPGFTMLVNLTAGDLVSALLTAQDGVGTGYIVVTNAFLTLLKI